MIAIIEKKYIIIRSKTWEDIVCRLQSNPLYYGLNIAGDDICSVCSPDDVIDLSATQQLTILFHYYDKKAIKAVRKIKAKKNNISVFCLGCDIFKYDDYVILQDFVDLFVVPTELHRQRLSARLDKPIFFLPEGIDPIGVGNEPDRPFPLRSARRICWFGYPESFDNRMTSVMPTILENLRLSNITEFAVITEAGHFKNKFHVPVINYTNDNFSNAFKRFDYVVLSHLPLDLAMNSYIKSPNKLITAILSGVIPVASDTPSYRSILHEFGLERFLFSSPAHLNAILSRLDPVQDSISFRESKVAEGIKRKFSNEKVAAYFLDICKIFEKSQPIKYPNHTMENDLNCSEEGHRRLVPRFFRKLFAN